MKPQVYPQLVQYRTTPDLRQEHLKVIAKKFLKYDHRWHFFHESVYGLLRITRKDVALERWLKKQKYTFTIGEWNEPHATVKNYQELFEPVFHSYALLALSSDVNQPESLKVWKTILGRLIHCFCNMSATRRENTHVMEYAFNNLQGQLEFSMHWNALQLQQGILMAIRQQLQELGFKDTKGLDGALDYLGQSIRKAI